MATSQYLFRALAFCTTALSLLALSATLTTTAFFIQHVYSTRPHHTHHFFFKTNSTCSQQQANIPLHSIHGLRSVKDLKASLQLSLPESNINLDNSVFQISALLSGQYATSSADDQQLCLAQGAAQFSLYYRSQVQRAIRAVVLSLPLLLGLVSEYQHFEKQILHFDARTLPQHPVVLHQLSITLHSSHVQIADAVLKLRVTRDPFFKAIIQQGNLSNYLLITMTLWYAMLIALSLSVAAMHFVRGILRRFVYPVAAVDEISRDAQLNPNGVKPTSARPPLPDNCELSEDHSIPARNWSKTSSGSASSTTFGWGGRRRVEVSASTT